MNERIKELRKQAWKEAYDVDPDDPRIARAHKAMEEGMEKFAELIIKECANICELNGQSYTYSFTPAKARLAESTSNHCGLMIKKHFGVE